MLSVYTTRIEAERDEAPVLLGNGNLVEAGAIAGTGRHYAVWHDPYPKPAYLFAVVGGRLDKVAQELHDDERPRRRDRGLRGARQGAIAPPTRSTRSSASMRWDERVFGREYDLDVFNVVAVSDFNMGAMENKGLNIFNDKYVLASPETATDTDYANIEAIIAHEYFHNWTGNRITCRDWFQLCLKEGLTVFRDQEFSSDERSRPVHRIAEVRTLRARQFSEDAGPLAHPVRPTQYREINNFYTATVYEKGAEIVRMLKTLIGETDFRRGMDRYFERCDGTAATVEDFLAAFADVTGRDLSHFARWYAQAGTPRVSAKGAYDAATATYRLELSPGDAADARPADQGADGDPGGARPRRRVTGGALPARCDRVGESGVFVLDQAADSLTFTNVHGARRSRRCSAASRRRSRSPSISTTTSFCPCCGTTAIRSTVGSRPRRWRLRLLVLLARSANTAGEAADGLAAALLAFLERDAARDPAFAAQVLALPSEAEIAQEIGSDVDPDAVHRARESLREVVGRRLTERLLTQRDELASSGRYSPDAASAGRRALRNVALDLIAAGDAGLGERLALEQFRTADEHDGPARRVSPSSPPSRARPAKAPCATSPTATATILWCSTSGSPCRR